MVEKGLWCMQHILRFLWEFSSSKPAQRRSEQFSHSGVSGVAATHPDARASALFSLGYLWYGACATWLLAFNE